MSTSDLDLTSDIAKTLELGTSRSRLSRIVRYLLLIGLLAGGVAAGAYWLKDETRNAVQYDTVPVERGALVVTVSATGTLEPITQVDVGIEVSGTIKTVEVDYNDNVEVGQVLARLDTSKLQAQTLQSEASLDAAKAKLTLAKATVEEAKAQMARLEEVRKLSGGKMPSQSDFDTQKASLARARADEGSAKASVAQAQATLDANRSDLKKAVIESPIKGVVLERDVEPGQTVAAQFQSPVLFTLAEDLAQMELMVDVDEADVGQVAAGQEATFTVDAYPDRVFPATTTQVRYGSETVDGVVTYKAVLKVDNSELILLPGMTATAQMTVNKRENALLVPNTALRYTPPKVETEEKAEGGSIISSILPHPPREESTPRDDPSANGREQDVYVLRDGQPVAVHIVKGVSDGRRTEVLEGALEPGMKLITDTVAPK